MENNSKNPINLSKLKKENYDGYIDTKINIWQSRLKKYKEQFDLLRNQDKSKYAKLSKDLMEGHLEPWGWAKFVQTKKGQQAQKLLEKNMLFLKKAEKRLEFWKNEKIRRDYTKSKPEIDFEGINNEIKKIREQLSPFNINISQTSKGMESNREWRIYTINNGFNAYDFYISCSGNWYLVNIHNFNEKIEYQGINLKEILRKVLKKIYKKFTIEVSPNDQCSLLNFKTNGLKELKKENQTYQSNIDKFF